MEDLTPAATPAQLYPWYDDRIETVRKEYVTPWADDDVKESAQYTPKKFTTIWISTSGSVSVSSSQVES